MEVIYLAFFFVFGLAGGFFVGSCNTAGLIFVFPPGLITGGLLAIPMLREKLWTPAGVVVAAAVVGALIVTALPDTNGLKQLCRNGQSMLNIKMGPYKMGNRE